MSTANASAEFRLRRSVLFMPGSNVRALDKARGLPVDAVIFDWEDAVATDAKIRARESVMAALATGGYGTREIIVRINALDTPWGLDDARAAACCGAHGVLVPKVASAADILEVREALCAAGAPDNLPLWAMAETPRGILSADAIAGSDPAFGALVVGTEDLGKALRVPPSPGREGLLTSLSHCVLAARANGVDVLDGVFPDLADEAGYRQQCHQGRELGFDGKTLIHPRQIATANSVFSISEQRVAWAGKIVAAWEQTEAGGAGVVLVDGRLVERLHVDEARRLLALHAMQTGPDEAH